MKTLKLFSCFILFLAFISCTTNEDETYLNTSTLPANRQSHNFVDINNPLHFKWGLYHLQGGFAGFNEFYTYGEITWQFSLTDQTFTVLNLSHSFPSGGYLPTGTYPCNITTYPNGTFCVSNGSLSGCYVLNSGMLYLTEGKVSDGISLQFVH